MDAKMFSEKVNAKVEEYMTAAAEATQNMTESELDAFKMKVIGKAKGDVKAQEKADALALVLEIVKTVAGDDKDAMNAVNILTVRQRVPGIPGEAKVGAPRVSRFTMLDEQFATPGQTVDEVALFGQYKMGRKDIYWIIADAIKQAKDTSKRKWISFNPETGIYTYESQGALPPDGWKGYVPVELKAPKVAVSPSEEPVANPDLDPTA